MATDNDQIRELFIDELEQVTGGGPDLKEKLRDLLNSTMACGEEGPPC
jgi:hypothetical protein